MLMIIDGTNLILGRLATYVAKKTLEGETVTIVNCEKVIITGSKTVLIQKFKDRIIRGHPYHGPFYPKMPDRIVRRTIRGMLPYKQERGCKAFGRVKCFIGVPEQFKTTKLQTLEGVSISKLKTLNFITVNDLSKFVGKGVT